MVGEKHVPIGRFGLGWLDSSIYNGEYLAPVTRGAGPDCPLIRDLTAYKDVDSWVFGSYHVGVCQFVFCDGSVHPLPLSIDPYVLGLLACRHDGEPLPDF